MSAKRNFRPRLWLADTIRETVLARLSGLNCEARLAAVRPRLVIFDYMESPVGAALRTAAAELGFLVSVEAVEKTLPASALRDRFRLLEKSRGIHGVVLPSGLTPSHRACLEAHPELAALDLDSIRDGFSPQMMAFLQLAAAFEWDPQGRRATLLVDGTSSHLSAGLENELKKVGMTVEVCREDGQVRPQPLSRSECIWLCHGRPVRLNQLHLCSNAVIIDSGKAFDLAPSLSWSQNRLLACRARGLCPAEGGLAGLVTLHRLQRVLRRALISSGKLENSRHSRRPGGQTKGVRG